MNYRKINFLNLLKVLFLSTIFIIIMYLSTRMSETYKSELDKNLKLEQTLAKDNRVQKLELFKKHLEKKERYDTYKDYLLVTIFILLTVFPFLHKKIETENKKLDEFEKIS